MNFFHCFHTQLDFIHWPISSLHFQFDFDRNVGTHLHVCTSFAMQGFTFLLMFPFAFIFSADLIDYMIGNGQHLKVFHLVQILNLEDKYPPFSLLKGYIEKAKQTTSVDIFRKNETHKSLV